MSMTTVYQMRWRPTREDDGAWQTFNEQELKVLSSIGERRNEMVRKQSGNTDYFAANR